MQVTQIENAEVHAACVAEKASRAKSLLEMSALCVEKMPGKKRIEELAQRLTVELSARERRAAGERHMNGNEAVKEKVTELDR